MTKRPYSRMVFTVGCTRCAVPSYGKTMLSRVLKTKERGERGERGVDGEKVHEKEGREAIDIRERTPKQSEETPQRMLICWWIPVGGFFLPRVALAVLSLSKILQNLRVSSPATETTVSPSGDIAICSTREVWPVSSASFSILG